MYKSNKKPYSARYMECTIGDYDLHIEPPKLKTLRKFEAIDDDSSIEDMLGVISAVASKNKEKITLSAEYIEDNLDTVDLVSFFEDFGDFIDSIHNSPN